MNETKKIWLMLAPALTIIIVLFVGGFIYGFIQSLNYMPTAGMYELNFDAYRAIFNDPTFLTSLGFTLWIAIASTVLSIIVAIALSMGIRKAFKGKKRVMLAYQFPLPMPHLVAGIMILMMFSQSGLVSRICASMGLTSSTSDFPVIVYSKQGWAIILSLMWKFVPFVGVAVIGILQSTGTQYEEAAISLGANSWQRFRYVLFPVMLPSITTSAILIFAYAFSSYEIPFLLGSTFPKTLSILAYEKFANIDLTVRPQAMAMTTIITGVVLIIVLIYKRLVEKFRY